MNVEVIGLGYVGLPTAILLAQSGNKVFGVDINLKLLDELNTGSYKAEDDSLNSILSEVIANGNLTFGNTVKHADAYIIAVPTPVINQGIDLKYVETACKNVSLVMQKNDLIIVESTIAPGTTRGPVKKWLEVNGLRAGVDFGLAHMPERVQPGDTMNELVYNQRVSGGIDEQSTKRAKELYLSFAKGQIEEADDITAETTKVVENTFRDVNIAFANEILVICEKLNINPWKVIKLANNHPRVNILKPGPGVGGHCIPLDPWFLIQQSPEDAKLLVAARERNSQMPIKVAEDITSILKKIDGTEAALLGCAYKANTSDDRETPSKKITEILQNNNVKYNIYDPHVKNLWTNSTRSFEECVKNTDLIVLIVAHNEFLLQDPNYVANVTKCRTILDCTGELDKTIWENAGFSIIQIGQVSGFIN